MSRFHLNDRILEQIKGVQQVAQTLWHREWAERNGGNISIDISDLCQLSHLDLNLCPRVEYPGLPAESAGRVYFVKGQGERIRDLESPELAGCILIIDRDARGYHLLWGGRNRPDYRPTSEFIAHVGLLLDQRGQGNQCVVHTHPLELIALSHHPEIGQSPDRFEQVCWQMLPEVRVFVPRGIALVPYALSGTAQLADLTVAALRHNDVAVWHKHGAVATGQDANQAFDFIDVANKGAKIYLQCLAAGYEPVGLSTEELEELESEFGLNALKTDR